MPKACPVSVAVPDTYAPDVVTEFEAPTASTLPNAQAKTNPFIFWI
jgi:hypothetical protein